MGAPLYLIRNYRPDDFDSLIQLHIEAKELEPTGHCPSPQALSERLNRPNYLPGQELFLAKVAAKVIGYIDVTPELGIGRVVLNLLVHPEHRRKGLATKLCHYALRRATELGAKVAHMNITQDNVAAKSLLPKLGFGFVRRFLELRLELAQDRLLDTEHIAPPCRHLKRGEEDKLAQIQNRCFAGSWGYNPNTKEDISYRLNLSDCSPEHVILACDRDKPIAYCWTLDLPRNRSRGSLRGRIYMIGVDPDYRGQGLGRQVLLAGLFYLRGNGVKVAELMVDSENEVALALYESLGFKVQAASFWYEKALD